MLRCGRSVQNLTSFAVSTAGDLRQIRSTNHERRMENLQTWLNRLGEWKEVDNKLLT